MSALNFFRLPSDRLITEYPMRIILKILRVRAFTFFTSLLFGFSFVLAAIIAFASPDDKENTFFSYFFLVLSVLQVFALGFTLLMTIEFESLYIRSISIAFDHHDFSGRVIEVRSRLNAFQKLLENGPGDSDILLLEEEKSRIDAEVTDLEQVGEKAGKMIDILERDVLSFNRKVGWLPMSLSLNALTGIRFGDAQELRRALDKFRTTFTVIVQPM